MSPGKFQKLESSPYTVDNVVFDPQISNEDLDVLLLFHTFETLTHQNFVGNCIQSFLSVEKQPYCKISGPS